MDDRWRYLTILKGLPAEYGALSALAADVEITPLIQLWDKRPARDPADEEDEDLAVADATEGSDAGQTTWLDDAGQDVWSRLRTGLLDRKGARWADRRPLLLDGGWLDNAEAYRTILDNVRASGRTPIPVTGLDRDPTYQEIVAGTARVVQGGVVLRLLRSDFAGGAAGLEDQIKGLLDVLTVSPDRADLVIDLRELPALYKERDEMTVEALIRSLPYVTRWRNLAVAASGMPRNGAGFKRSEITPFSRSEWWLWQELLARASALPRIPVFGDYGVINPERVEAIGEAKGKRARIPWILYTVNDNCLSVRAEDLARDGSVDDLRAQLIRLRDEGDWSGPEFSKGDEWIAKIIDGDSKAGGWQSWRKTGLSHHWTYVSKQLPNLPAA